MRMRTKNWLANQSRRGFLVDRSTWIGTVGIHVTIGRQPWNGAEIRVGDRWSDRALSANLLVRHVGSIGVTIDKGASKRLRRLTNREVGRVTGFLVADGEVRRWLWRERNSW